MTEEVTMQGADAGAEPNPHDIEGRLDRLFTGRLFATLAEVAAVLGIDAKTLGALSSAGRIQYVALGTGTLRPRRRFTKEHVLAFLRTPTPASPRPPDVDVARIRDAVRRRMAAGRRGT